jgi:hypothetical protein
MFLNSLVIGNRLVDKYYKLGLLYIAQGKLVKAK